MPIQPPVFISAANPSEVASAKMLEVFLGTPTPSRMLIFTGIAMPPGVESEGLLDSYEITIDLNQSITKPILSSAATVGLASIHNEDSDFLFATDDVAVFADTSTGRLQLKCNTAVLGTGSLSTLARFSYQATLIVESEEALVSGSIRWSPFFLAPIPGHDLKLFTIQAFTGPASAKIVQKTVNERTKAVAQNGLLSVDYEIHEPPVGQPFMISVTPNQSAFLANPTGPMLTIAFIQVFGPSPIELNLGHIREKPVDFMAVIADPH